MINFERAMHTDEHCLHRQDTNTHAFHTHANVYEYMYASETQYSRDWPTRLGSEEEQKELSNNYLFRTFDDQRNRIVCMIQDILSDVISTCRCYIQFFVFEKPPLNATRPRVDFSNCKFTHCRVRSGMLMRRKSTDRPRRGPCFWSGSMTHRDGLSWNDGPICSNAILWTCSFIAACRRTPITFERDWVSFQFPSAMEIARLARQPFRKPVRA